MPAVLAAIAGISLLVSMACTAVQLGRSPLLCAASVALSLGNAFCFGYWLVRLF